MDSLPDDCLRHILSYIDDARDVAACNCVSKKWNESTSYIRSLYFPFRSFCSPSSGLDIIANRMLSRVVCLEELIVYSPFYSPEGLESWLSHLPFSLRHLQLRMDYICQSNDPRVPGFTHGKFYEREVVSKLSHVGTAASTKNLETLKLRGVSFMEHAPNWRVFENMKNLEIRDVRISEPVLALVFHSCPFLTTLVLHGCKGVTSVNIDLPYLEKCKLHFYDSYDCSLHLTSPKIENLKVEGFNQIRVLETKHLRKLSISTISSGCLDAVEFGNLKALEFLSMRGTWWCWDEICKLLKLATEVNHLCVEMKYTGDLLGIEPFPVIDFVEFFNSHKKLRKFHVSELMFAALCQKDIDVKSVESGFAIPVLEEFVVRFRSPRNAEQKMSTLASLLKYGKCLKFMIIRTVELTHDDKCFVDDYFDDIHKSRCINLNIKICNNSIDDFCKKISMFRSKNPKIVRIIGVS